MLTYADAIGFTDTVAKITSDDMGQIIASFATLMFLGYLIISLLKQGFALVISYARDKYPRFLNLRDCAFIEGTPHEIGLIRDYFSLPRECRDLRYSEQVALEKTTGSLVIDPYAHKELT